MSELKNRIDFVYLFDVQDGNPNGDPDAGNLPRVDAETGMGLVTDVCLKRKVRNYVQVSKECAEGYDIFIKEKAVLDSTVERTYNYDEVKKADAKDMKNVAKKLLCKNFFDIRTFGAVIATKGKQDQVRGPIQLTFARSVEPIAQMEHSITRMAVTKEEDLSKEKTMGRKSTVPYGLYLCHGFISANLAKQTGFTEEDLNLFWEALKNMFDVDRSASRGLMSARKLIVFKHASELGNAPANQLFDLVKVEKTGDAVARCFTDYKVTTDKGSLPENVTIEELL
jgi:CRISPR-associated protein Csd2